MFIIKEGTPTSDIGKGTDDSTKDHIQKWLQAQGLTVRTADEDKSYLDSHVQKEVDKMYADSMNEVDAGIFEGTGIKKNNNEKTSAYSLRAAKESLANKNAELEAL